MSSPQNPLNNPFSSSSHGQTLSRHNRTPLGTKGSALTSQLNIENHQQKTTNPSKFYGTKGTSAVHTHNTHSSHGYTQESAMLHTERASSNKPNPSTFSKPRLTVQTTQISSFTPTSDLLDQNDIRHLGVPNELEIGQSAIGLDSARQIKDSRGISFNQSLYSSKSSYKCSNSSSIEEDDISSVDAGCISHEDESDRYSSNEGDNDDLDEKIKWFFLRIESVSNEEAPEKPLN